jgi:hypothetical protein
LLNDNLRAGDFLARYGGEEFAIIFRDADLNTACAAADDLRRIVHNYIFALDQRTVPITISCGLALAVPGESIAAMLERCDEALYAAKDAGRNAVFYHSGLRPHRFDGVSPATPAFDDELLARELTDLCHSLREKLRQTVSSPPHSHS